MGAQTLEVIPFLDTCTQDIYVSDVPCVRGDQRVPLFKFFYGTSRSRVSARSRPRSNWGGTKASVIFNANGPVAGRVRPDDLVGRAQRVALHHPDQGVREQPLGAQVLLPLRAEKARRGQIGGDDPKPVAPAADPEARPHRRGRRARARQLGEFAAHAKRIWFKFVLTMYHMLYKTLYILVYIKSPNVI